MLETFLYRILGYTEVWSYTAGMDYTNPQDPKLIGWKGNSTNGTIRGVLKRISILKKVEDCPSVENSYAWYEPNKSDPVDFKHIKFELTKGLYPNPICCKVIHPKDAQNKIMNGLEIAFKSSSRNYKSMKVLISDKVSSSVFEQHNTNVLGDKILSPQNENGYNHFKVKVFQEIHLENDPNYPCIDYKYPGEFHKCLESEFLNENMKILNCTAPWMTDDEELWCKGNLTLNSRQKISQWGRFVADVNVGEEPHGKCSVPCKTTNYYVNEFGYKEDSEYKGVIIIFDKFVKKTISELQIGPRTLVTRFGGIIGVGKNLLWVVIFAISAIGFCSGGKNRGDKNIYEEDVETFKP